LTNWWVGGSIHVNINSLWKDARAYRGAMPSQLRQCDAVDRPARNNPSENLWGVTLSGEAEREAPVRTEPHPTNAGASHVAFAEKGATKSRVFGYALHV
jgi:hypothetical protein